MTIFPPCITSAPDLIEAIAASITLDVVFMTLRINAVTSACTFIPTSSLSNSMPSRYPHNSAIFLAGGRRCRTIGAADAHSIHCLVRQLPGMSPPGKPRESPRSKLRSEGLRVRAARTKRIPRESPSLRRVWRNSRRNCEFRRAIGTNSCVCVKEPYNAIREAADHGSFQSHWVLTCVDVPL